jgi:hypothetical protein
MKLPSIFKTPNYQRFDIKPRYYDPIKEEIEERTARIKKELEQGKGLQEEENLANYSGTSIKGSFASYRGGKSTQSTSVFSSISMIRALFFFGLIIAAFGYLYIGPEIFTYLSAVALLVVVGYFFFNYIKKGKK